MRCCLYKPSNKVKLKFRLKDEGQQRFTRADTLGADYTPERIAEQIAEIQKKLAATNISPEMLIEPPKTVEVFKPDRTVITEEEFLAPLYEKSATSPPENKEDVWAEIRDMRGCDKIIADLESRGITSLDDLRRFSGISITLMTTRTSLLYLTRK